MPEASTPNHSDSLPSAAFPRINRAAHRGKGMADEHLLAVPRPEDAGFIHTDPWRIMRIAGEFVEGFDALANLGPAVTVFGSARVRPEEPQYQAAVDTARLLGEAGFNIITGGGPGIMEAASRGAADAGVHAVGMGIELPFEQKLNKYVDISVEFRYFFARKTMFVKYASAFVVFPGGFGTMDELFESLTLIQTGKVRNFPVILYGAAYWHGLLEWLRNPMLQEEKVCPEDLELLLLTDSPEEIRDIVLRSTSEADWRGRKEAGSRKAMEEAMSR